MVVCARAIVILSPTISPEVPLQTNFEPELLSKRCSGFEIVPVETLNDAFVAKLVKVGTLNAKLVNIKKTRKPARISRDRSQFWVGLRYFLPLVCFAKL